MQYKNEKYLYDLDKYMLELKEKRRLERAKNEYTRRIICIAGSLIFGFSS